MPFGCGRGTVPRLPGLKVGSRKNGLLDGWAGPAANAQDGVANRGGATVVHGSTFRPFLMHAFEPIRDRLTCAISTERQK
jgi:hypothetical protein